MKASFHVDDNGYLDISHKFAPLKTGKKALKKYETDYSYDKANDVMFIRWLDNSETTTSKNYDAVDPMVIVQRYSREKKKNGGIKKSLTFGNYIKYAGGVDLHDNVASNYRNGIRGKKK